MSGRSWVFLVAFGLVAPGVAASLPFPAAALGRELFGDGQRAALTTRVRVVVPHEDATLAIDGTHLPGHGTLRETLRQSGTQPVTFTVTWAPNSYTTLTRTAVASIAGEMLTVDLTAAGPGDRAEIRYVPTPHYVVQEMIALAGIRAGDVVFEPGCGDARVTIAAVTAGAQRGVGIDLDPERVQESAARVREAGLEGRIEIRRGDALNIPDLANATVVFLYMGDEFNSLIKPVLLRQLRPGARIVSHRFTMGDWRPDKTVSLPDEAGTTDVHLWVVPSAAANRSKQ